MIVMASKPGKKRGHTIPRVAWWCEAATVAVDALGLSHKEVAQEVQKRFGYEVHATGVTRCLSGEVLTLTLARYLSIMLGLPPPIIEPSSESEALQLIGKQERERIRSQIGVLTSGFRTGLHAEGHPGAVEQASEQRRGKRR